MLSSSSYGGYRDRSSHVTIRQLEDDSHEINRSQVGGLTDNKGMVSSRDESQGDESALLPGIPLLDVDDRIHNALLEELCADYGVTDSSDIDLLTFDLPSTDMRPVNQCDNVRRQDDRKRMAEEVRQREQRYILPDITTPRSYDRIDLSKAVASPTISSSCEESQTCTSIDNCSAEISSAAVSVQSLSGCQSVVAKGIETLDQQESCTVLCNARHLEGVQHSKDGTISAMKRELDWSETKSNKSCYATDDDYSGVSSPGEMSVAKKLKITNGGDLLEDVRNSYEFVRGAAIFSPAASQHLATSQSFWPQPTLNKKQIIMTPQGSLPSVCDPSKSIPTSSSSSWSAQFTKKRQSNCDGCVNNHCGSADAGSNHSYVEFPINGDNSGAWKGSGMLRRQGFYTGHTDTGSEHYRSSTDVYKNMSNKEMLIRAQSVTKSNLQHSSAQCHSSYGNGQSEDAKGNFNVCGSSVDPSTTVNRHNEHHKVTSDNRIDAFSFQAQAQSVQRGSVLCQNQQQENSSVFSNYACNGNENEFLQRRYRNVPFSRACSSNQSIAVAHNSTRFGSTGESSIPGSFHSVAWRPGSAGLYSLNANGIHLASSNSNASLPNDQTVPCIQPTNVYNSGVDNRFNFINKSDVSSDMLMKSNSPQFSSVAGYRQQMSQRLHPYISDDVHSTARSMYSHNSIPTNALVEPWAQEQSSRLSSVYKGTSTDQSCRGFVQHLVGEGSGPYRLHPLFPLLRDLVIADMNFEAPSFPYPLLAGIPKSFDRLVENYFTSNRRAATTLGVDPSIDNIIMDALRYAHSSLIDKIRCQKLKEGFQEVPRPPVDDVCAQFSQFGQQTTGQGPLPSSVNQTLWSSVPISSANRSQQDGIQYLSSMSPVVTVHGVESDIKLCHSSDIYSDPMCNTPSYRKQSQSSYEYMSSISEGSDSVAGNEKANKNKVLPNEAKAIMVDWLRAHQENPYPNDDEKEELIASTKLTISQINYWFTNARRRLLPKWAMQRRHAFERDTERHLAIPIQ